MKLKSLRALFLTLGLFATVSSAPAAEWDGELLPNYPESEFLPAAPGEPSVDFCSRWNPEFAYRGYRCCSDHVSRAYASTSKRSRRARKNACAPDRMKWSFCDEMTEDQRHYIDDVKSGRIPDILAHIDQTMGRKGNQAFCGAGNGFLAFGRPLLPTEENRLEFRNLPRCANFGTDPLIGMMEWLGREVKREYFEPEFSKIRLVIGDLSAPRGGCMAGRFGRRAHKSHTGGEDIDLAFFNPRAGHPPEERFTRNFYVASNWWFIKKAFKNPYACVKVMFIDKAHIAKLGRYAKDDPEWEKLRPFIRHVRGHRDHYHIRVGSGPGVPGCQVDPNLEEDEDISDFSEAPTLEAAPEKEPETDEEGALPSGDRQPNSTTSSTSAAAPASPTVAAAGVRLASTLATAHKQEPMITAQYEVKPKRARKPKRVLKKRR